VDWLGWTACAVAVSAFVGCLVSWLAGVLASSVATENAAIITVAVLAIAFVTLTSPVSGHAIARAAHRRRGRSR